MKFVILFVVFFFSVFSMWGQCPSYNHIFYSQEDINHFETDFPNCIYANDINIKGWVQNLDSLKNLRKINHLHIENTQIKSLGGLESVNSITRIELLGNMFLEDISALSNVSTPLGTVYIQKNESLSDCQVLCNLKNSTYLNIDENAQGCSHNYDFFCDDFVRGTVYYDKNQNKHQDDDEYGIPGIFTYENELGFGSVTNAQGGFGFKGELGKEYVVKPKIDPDKWISTTESSIEFTFGDDPIKHQLNFGIIPKQVTNAHDIELVLIHGRWHNFIIGIKNNGAFMESGELELGYSPKLDVTKSLPGWLTHDTEQRKITWAFKDLPAYGMKFIDVFVDANAGGVFGALELKLTQDVEDGTSKEALLVRRKFYDAPTSWGCHAYVFPEGEGEQKEISSEQTLTYQIKGEMNGSAIVVENYLDGSLDPSTFQLIYATHQPMIKIGGGEIRFSMVDPYYFDFDLVYQIKPYNDIQEGDVVKNYAILPGLFSTCTTEILEQTIVSPLRQWQVGDEELLIGPNVTTDFFRVQLRPEYEVIGSKLLVFNALGQQVKSFLLDTNKRYFVDDLGSGFYTVVLYVEGAKQKVQVGKLFIH